MAESRVKPEDDEGEAAAKENQHMKSAETTVKEKAAEKTARKSIWDCGSPLYDSYELVSVTHVIERHWMIFPYQAAASSNNSSSDETLRKPSSSQKTVMNRIMMKMTKNKTGGEGRNKRLARFCCFWGSN